MTDEEILEHARRLQRATDRIIGNPHKHCQEMATQKDTEIARLRAALKPFADISSVYVRRAETFGWKDADGVFGAADITKDVTIRVGDCRAALKALE